MDPRLDRTTPLVPDSAVAAVIIVGECYLLQQRDSKRGIFFPGCWGCFGGTADAGETEQDALLRELNEELGLKPAPESIGFFTRFTFDLAFAGLGTIWRAFYELDVSPKEMIGLRLGEGSAMRLFSAEAILTETIPLTPYDAYALWLHINRRRLVRGT